MYVATLITTYWNLHRRMKIEKKRSTPDTSPAKYIQIISVAVNIFMLLVLLYNILIKNKNSV